MHHVLLSLRAAAPLPLLRAPTASIACNAAGGEGLLASPELWAIGTTALLCTVFAAFEKGVELAEVSVPKYVRPSIDAILREMATLGLIGLLVQTDILGLEKGFIAELSERFLGESELCFELFELVHQFLFQTAIAYFLASGLLVAGVVRRLEDLFAVLDKDGDGLLTPAELSEAQKSGLITGEDSPLGTALLASERAFIDESFPAEEAAEYRERGGLTTDDVRALAGERVEELVEIDPRTIFALTATLGTEGFATDLQRGNFNSFEPGDYAAGAPLTVVLLTALAALSYAGFRPGPVDLGQKLFGPEFVLSSIKVLSFAAAFLLCTAVVLVPVDTAALLAGSAPSQAVVTESAVVALSIGVPLAVLVRLGDVLFQFIGSASRARLELVASSTD